MKKIDIISIIGILIALLAILGGQALEGGHIGSLLQVTAFLIVMGGTIGAVMLQNTGHVFLTGLLMIKWIFIPPNTDQNSLIKDIVKWSQNSRKNGLISLGSLLDQIPDTFIKNGIQQVIDGVEPENIRNTMELELDLFEEEHKKAAKIWEAAGGYAPTIGILGAVMGLIHVMENLSDPSKLGGGIAVAFVATIYGVGLANLFFLPIANKIKSHIEKQVLVKMMIIEGLVSISNGDNPKLIEIKLNSFISK
jgi:chemotaxis protein MotA